MRIGEAIKQRPVDLKQVEMYEATGVCFGRERKDINFGSKEVEKVDRHL